MAWIYLIGAGIMEWGWPVGLKLGWTDKGAHYGWIAFAVLTMTASGALLLIAQRTIPMGTAYAVWTGIGAVGTFILGILLFDEPATLTRFFLGLEAIDEEGLSKFRKRVPLGRSFEALEFSRSLGVQVAINIIADPDWDRERFKVVCNWCQLRGYKTASQ